jgi:uncharacterized protein
MSLMEFQHFKRFSDGRTVNLASYIKELDHKEHKIYIGCDSQNEGHWTHFALVIVIHKSNRGCHVLYQKSKTRKIKSTFDRLWREVESSLKLALYLQESKLLIIDFIDIDLNPDPEYLSNEVFRAALGYVTSMGFKARFKPEAHAASSCADYLLH